MDEFVFHTAETRFRRWLGRSGMPPALSAHREREDWEEFHGRAQRAKPAQGIEVHARVNHGRWIVDCPFCDGAQYGAPSDPRFMCVDCDNLGQDWVAVVFPPPGVMARIEATLRRRPRVEFMNWRPGESVADLEAENREHGIDDGLDRREDLGSGRAGLGVADEHAPAGQPPGDLPPPGPRGLQPG